MKRKLSYCICMMLCGAALLSAGCGTGRSCVADIPSCLEISPPEIHITGEKTAIESQIVGDYRELEKDAWIVSSVKTGVVRTKGSPVAMSGDEELFRAMKVREFNEDAIRRYKDEGAVGEAGTGLLAYVPVRKYEISRDARGTLTRVVEDENSARRIIFERSVRAAGDGKPDAARIQEFGKRFAEEQAAIAKKNDWIQDKSGDWVRKK